MGTLDWQAQRRIFNNKMDGYLVKVAGFAVDGGRLQLKKMEIYGGGRFTAAQ